LTDAEEEEIATEILEHYIMTAKMFNSMRFRELTLKKYEDSTGSSDGFRCSDHYIQNFKRRTGFSSRRFHLRRRRRQIGRGDIEVWKNAMIALLDSAEHHWIINCDETAWKVVPSGLLTWARVGQDSVEICMDASDKEPITVLASMTTSSEKFPFFMVGKRRTSRVERSKLGDADGHEASHSPSGWTTAHAFREYLTWMGSLYPDNAPIHRILDCYSVHRLRETREYADQIGIELDHIPPGRTGELQPLDRYVFGALKAICRRLFHCHCQHTNNGVKRPDAAVFLQEAWVSLETRIIGKGWGIFEDAFEGPDADDENEAENPGEEEWPEFDLDALEDSFVV
jgi:hypothetical protein